LAHNNTVFSQILSLDVKGIVRANHKKSRECARLGILGGQLTPLGQGGGAVLLEDVSAVEVAVLVEMIVD